MTCLTALAIYLSRLSLNGVALFCLPFIALLFLVLDGAYSHGIIDNGLSGRLLSSGVVLYSWGAEEWLALKGSALTLEDCGYGWLLSNLGLIPMAANVKGRGHRPDNGSRSAVMYAQRATGPSIESWHSAQYHLLTGLICSAPTHLIWKRRILHSLCEHSTTCWP